MQNLFETPVHGGRHLCPLDVSLFDIKRDFEIPFHTIEWSADDARHVNITSLYYGWQERSVVVARAH